MKSPSIAFDIFEHLDQVELQFKKREPLIQAFLPEENRFERLRREAESLSTRYPNAEDRPPLFGVLVGIKDIFHVDGFATHAGSRLPVDALKGKEAESVRKLKAAGALIVGKTVTTEFAYFSPGPTHNPHNLEHTPGGSSSGSAAAIAAGFCELSLGTQTIGSIIRPAAFCGVVGLKPSYDRISRDGVIPLSPSLDHVGYFASNVPAVKNAARFLYKDWNESTDSLSKPIHGIPDGPYLESASAEGLAHFENICQLLTDAGYELKHVNVMPDFQKIRDRQNLILAAEAALVHSEWFAKYEGLYAPKTAELIRRGKTISESSLKQALEDQIRFRDEIIKLMTSNQIDLWIAPSAPGPAPKGLESTGDPVMNLPWTQAGLPSINLPAGKNQNGLPLGLQLIGGWYKDEALLTWAENLEKALVNL
jgi:Asp-tRNA(Asn)/Glu-tRNA(Gln) amidotransferase A subunit family amidase